MSTRSAERTPVRDDRMDLPDDPRAVFETIVSSGSVCRTCFRRLNRQERLAGTQGDRIEALVPWVEYDLPTGAHRFDILDRQYYERVREQDRLGTFYSDERRHRYCTGCGVVNTERSPDCRSIERAKMHAAQLSVTLEEYGYDVDWMLLIELVQQLKSKPDLAGRDMAVFGKATAAAIEHSR